MRNREVEWLEPCGQRLWNTTMRKWCTRVAMRPPLVPPGAADLPSGRFLQPLIAISPFAAMLRIYDKLGVSNRVELVLYALTHRGVKKTASSPPKPVMVVPPPAMDCIDSSEATPVERAYECVVKN